MSLVVDWTTAPLAITVSGVSAQSGAMAARTNHRDNTVYWFSCTTACWIKQGSNPAATAGTAGEMFVPANVVVPLCTKDGAKVAVIQNAAGGTATLTRMREV